MEGRKDLGAWEWVIIFGLMAIAIVITESIGIVQKWEDAVVYTVVLFAAIILGLRRLWRHQVFWQNLLLVFALHVLAVIIIVQIVPTGWRGIPGLLMVIAAGVEGALILSVLWKRVRRTRINDCGH